MRRFVMLCVSVLLLLSVVLTSCKTISPIVTIPHNDSIVVHYELLHDSIYIDRAHYMYLKGDTVYLHDTVTQKYFSITNHIDTVYRDKEVVIEHPPEKYVPDFYKWCAGILICLIILLVGYIVARVVIKVKTGK